MCRRLILAAMACWTVAGEVIDLSHGHVSGAIDCWLPDERFVIFGHRIETGPDGWYSTAKFSMSEHCGTHVDAPFHVDFNRWKLDQIPLDHMVADGVHINLSQEVKGNNDFLLTADHLIEWERVNGPLPQNCVILVNFGWAHKFGNLQSYYGATERPLRFPGISEGAAQWIVDSGKAYGVGVDGPGVDPGGAARPLAHRKFAGANVFGLENVALNGTALPSRGFKLVVLPLKIVGATGAPARILAFTDGRFE